jgi:hypothetical protein
MDGPSGLQVLDLNSQAFVAVANLGEFIALLKTLGEDSMYNLQVDILCSPDPVDCLG